VKPGDLTAIRGGFRWTLSKPGDLFGGRRRVDLLKRYSGFPYTKPAPWRQFYENQRFQKRIARKRLHLLVSFGDYKESHQGRSLTSPQYQKYKVLCYKNSMFHAGWIVCPYILSGFCKSDGLLELNAKKGGTNRLSRHLARHETGSNTQQVRPQDLGPRCRRNISDAAGLAAILDMRPLGFTDNHPGKAAFATEIFKAGQSVPVGITINPKSYLPSRQAVSDAVSRIAADLRKNYAKVLLERVSGLGGAVTVDGVTLKIQGKHYYDFTVHQLSIQKTSGLLAPPTFGIKTSTILFMEGPTVANADNIRGMLESSLEKEYGITLDTIQKTFSMVTDGAAVMAKTAGSSVSLNIAVPDETWMRCLVHMLHNCMKAVMEVIVSDDVLKEIM